MTATELTDFDEVIRYSTDPNNPDTDGDGLTDGYGVNAFHSSPTESDHDGDGVSDADELAQGTDPNDADTDNDGVPDGVDAVPLDPDLHFPRVAETSYAVIDLERLGFPKAIAFNDSLQLLDATYGNAKIWSNGQVTSIPNPPSEVSLFPGLPG